VFSVYIKRLVARVGLVISSNINKWLKALLANAVLIEVTLLGVSSPKAIR
jgi:hypothetical protein